MKTSCPLRVTSIETPSSISTETALSSPAKATVGGAEAKADSFETRLRGQQEELTKQVSGLEDADSYQVYSDLAAQESALQASLTVTARMQQPTLLNFL